MGVASGAVLVHCRRTSSFGARRRVPLNHEFNNAEARIQNSEGKRIPPFGILDSDFWIAIESEKSPHSIGT
ncbi:MAG: hypothetical protein DMG09_14500 [Acidobacteria bacterium]|nr:MAG: hypothetical protein DMG09_14500 [Acidobacteriota bacterium]